MTGRNFKAVIVSSIVTALAFGWNLLQFIFDAASFPENTNKLLDVLLRAPTYIPWIIFSAAIAVLAWSIWPRKKTKFQVSAARSQNEAVVDTDLAANDWMPLHEALRYLVYATRWASRQAPLSESEADKESFDKIVAREFRERLARGEITSRGKLGTTRESLERATEQIPAHFWINAFIQPHGEIVLAQDDRSIAATTGGDGPSYRAIIVRRSDVTSVWPPHTGDQSSPISPAVEETRARIAAEKQG